MFTTRALLVTRRSRITRFTKPIPQYRFYKDSANLGFDPGLLKDKPFDKHDHPTRPASVYIAQVPPIVAEERVVMCDGGGGQLGHPRVYINLDASKVDEPTPCGYCGQPFVQKRYVPKGHPLLNSFRSKNHKS